MIPVAPVIRIERVNGKAWIITVQCPYCTVGNSRHPRPGTHTHGGGDGPTPYRGGHVWSHCCPRSDDQGYVIGPLPEVHE